MRNKKKDEPKKTPEQQALEQQVDAIMDPKHPDDKQPVAEVVKSVETGKNVKTAPELSAKLRKQIAVSDVPTTPISIDKLDELTESIAEPKVADPPGPAAPAETDDVTEQSME